MTNRFGPLLIFATLVTFAGCGPSSETAPQTPAQRAALDELRNVRFDAMQSSLSALDSLSFIERVNLQELSDRDDSTVVIASHSFTNRLVRGDATVINSAFAGQVDARSAIDSAGAGELFSRPPLMPFDLPPPFLARRQEHKYRYSKRDTTIGTRQYDLFVAAGPRDSGELSRMVVDPETDEVVELIDRRTTSAFLFRADNVVRIRLAGHDSLRFVQSFDYDLRLKIPFRKARHFVLRKRYQHESPAA